MASEKISADTCVRLVEAAARTCQPTANVQTSENAPNWDAMANSFAALSTTLSYGSLLLGLIALLGAIGWGYVVKIWAERQAIQEAQRCAKNWLEVEATPLLRREMEEFRKTFPQEAPTSAEQVDLMVAGFGADRKEDDNGK